MSPHWGAAGDQVCRDYGGRGILALKKETPPALGVQPQAGGMGVSGQKGMAGEIT